MPSFYELFAGGGMARVGLGPGWTCLFANDIDPRKAQAYRANFGAGGELWVGDVAEVSVAGLPGAADLLWGSFPCQDLSLAGAGAGLQGVRSGAFYAVWDVVAGLTAEGRAPAIVALENVCGALTARGGRDFAAICDAFAQGGYRLGLLVIDAALFTPQSRPRLFMVGVRAEVRLPRHLLAPAADGPFHPEGLRRAVQALPDEARSGLVWWNLPPPPRRRRGLAEIIEDQPAGVVWRSEAETQRLLAMMTPLNRAKVEAVARSARRTVGGVYRRTRQEADGKRQRAEVRFDDISGCLRTPAGGSSRQLILVVEGAAVRSRLLSTREAARLMGLDDGYVLPSRYSDAYHLMGDGVAPPVVRHLAQHLFEPLLGAARTATAA